MLRRGPFFRALGAESCNIGGATEASRQYRARPAPTSTVVDEAVSRSQADSASRALDRGLAPDARAGRCNRKIACSPNRFHVHLGQIGESGAPLINAAICDDRYDPTYKPVVIEV